MSNNYMFNGKDISINLYIQIRAVTDVLKQRQNIDFQKAVMQFYNSKVCNKLHEVENGLWAESPEFIADMIMEESKVQAL